MDITPYVDRLRRDLAAAAEGSGDDVRAAAERLGYALDPSARLALMEALSQAAAEITAEMPRGSVDVRLDGRDLAFVVETMAGPGEPPAPPAPPTAPPPPGAEADGDATDSDALARISLRIPESVKARAEEAAAAAGQSLNTWLVNVVRAATAREGSINVDIDLSGVPFFGGGNRGRSSRRMTGWM